MTNKIIIGIGRLGLRNKGTKNRFSKDRRQAQNNNTPNTSQAAGQTNMCEKLKKCYKI